MRGNEGVVKVQELKNGAKFVYLPREAVEDLKLEAKTELFIKKINDTWQIIPTNLPQPCTA